MSAHSPGPWKWSQRTGDWRGKDDVLRDANDRPLVCQTMGMQDSPGGEADARLIAVAPEMLALLKALVAAESADEAMPLLHRAEELLARAQGDE